MDWLVELVRPGVEDAVDRMLHSTKRAEFHERFPKGYCPLCPMHVNLAERSGVMDRIKELAKEAMRD